jgi:hypothetical protein
MRPSLGILVSFRLRKISQLNSSYVKIFRLSDQKTFVFAGYPTAPLVLSFSMDFKYVLAFIISSQPCHRRLVAGISPRSPGFVLGSVQIRFVVDKVALGLFSPSASVSPVNIIPPWLSTLI